MNDDDLVLARLVGASVSCSKCGQRIQASHVFYVVGDGSHRALCLNCCALPTEFWLGLTGRQKEVIHRHHGIGQPCQPYAVIARDMRLSTERVRQIDLKVFKKRPVPHVNLRYFVDRAKCLNEERQ